MHPRLDFLQAFGEDNIGLRVLIQTVTPARDHYFSTGPRFRTRFKIERRKFAQVSQSHHSNHLQPSCTSLLGEDLKLVCQWLDVTSAATLFTGEMASFQGESLHKFQRASCLLLLISSVLLPWFSSLIDQNVLSR